MALTGTTDSLDFPVVNAYITTLPNATASGFVYVYNVTGALHFLLLGGKDAFAILFIGRQHNTLFNVSWRKPKRNKTIRCCPRFGSPGLCYWNDYFQEFSSNAASSRYSWQQRCIPDCVQRRRYSILNFMPIADTVPSQEISFILLLLVEDPMTQALELL
jgi:hypothetical protein